MQMKILVLLVTQLLLVPALFAQELPKKLNWLTNETDPVYASPNAKKGGKLNYYIASYPPTLRTVGPDSNHQFRTYIGGNNLSLVSIHPNTGNIVREIATHWAFDPDKQTMYFKIDPKAVWSDGHPVTADDFVYTLEYMRSKYLVAPWYNEFYTTQIDKVVKYDDHTISVSATKALPDLFQYCSIPATPKHFYKTLGPDHVTKYNWTIVPNTGPYQIDKIEKGKLLTFKRKKDWWAQDYRYFKNRFNVDEVSLQVIRDENIAFERFKKGELDAFVLELPNFWYDKSNDGPFAQGYIEKTWAYNDKPEPSAGFHLNLDDPMLKDINVRKALSHALNIEKVIKTVLRNDVERLPQYYTGYGEYTDTKLKPLDFDLAKVDEYLKKAGWTERGADGIRVKGGQKLTFRISYGKADATERLVVLKEEARKAGIDLELQLSDGTTFFKTVLEKKHQIAVWAWSTNIRPTFWEAFHSENAHKPKPNNIMNVDDKELDKIIMEQRDATDPKVAIRLAHEIERRINDGAYFISTYMTPFVRWGHWRWLRVPDVAVTKASSTLLEPMGGDPNLGGISMGGMFWIDEGIKKETEAARKAGKTFKPVVRIDKTHRAKSGA